MRHLLLICSYIGLFALANLMVSWFGVWVTPFNALIIIAADMVIRDRIQFSMGFAMSLYACFMAGLVTVVIAPDAGMIALASCASVILAGVASAVTFKVRSGDFYRKAYPANISAALVDSIAFPLIAFGSVMPGVTIAQFAAKVIGATVILMILKRLSK